MRLRLLSFNAGLLELFGRSVPVSYVCERLAYLPGEIRKIDADIVFFQEIYGERNRRKVADSLKDIYPYANFPRKQRGVLLGNSLMTLSRFPVTGATVLFRNASVDEAWIDSKGLLVSTHRLPTGEKLKSINVHTTAGGFFHHPESAYIDRVRSRQIKQVLENGEGFGGLLVIAGDLNAGPNVSDSNFRQLLSAGLVSVHDFLHGEVTEPTWDPLNPLNVAGPHKHCPPQRIDHIFVRTQDIASAKIRPKASEICLNMPIVPVHGEQMVSLSDHYGLCTDLDIASNSNSTAGDNLTDSSMAIM